MAKANRFESISRNKLILLIIWIVSFLVIIFSTIIIMAYSGPIPLKTKILMFFSAQIAGGFFFPISIGKIIQWIRDRDIATILWDFISDCGEAGLSRFYASRDTDDAKTNLKKRFDEHKEGDILLAGPSLRLFFGSDTYFRKIIESKIPQYEEFGVDIRIVNADMEKSISLSIRSFIEEFNPDGRLPRGESRMKFDWQFNNFDWNSSASTVDPHFNFEEFYKDFYSKYGKNATEHRCRVIRDLENVESGIDELNGKTRMGCLIHARKSICAPYFTAVIFPDICYYTPNMLCPEQPVNMPMLAFLRGGPVYNKILTHFKFLWWSAEDYKNSGDSSR